MNVIQRAGFVEFTSLFFAGIFFVIYPVANPDYEAYSVIYSTAELGGDWEVFYIYLNHLFRDAGFTYDQFRLLILLFSLTALSLLLSRLKPLIQPKRVFSIYSLVMAIGLVVFVLEYFVIRIRAGFSIGMFMWALYFLNRKSWYKELMALVMLVLAYFTHQFTASMLIVFVFIPWAFTLYGKSSKLKKYVYMGLLIFVTFGCLYYLNSAYAVRGENLFSPLNPVRAMSLTLIPLAIYCISSAEAELRPELFSGLYMFHPLFVRLYMFFTVGLAIMWLLGLTNESGEAIVRVFTLFSFPAILALRLRGVFVEAKIPTFILLSNALFFVYSLKGV